MRHGRALSSRGDVVARWFGVDRRAASDVGHLQKADPPPIALTAGQLILITGPSGAGKSTLLRRLRRRHRVRRWIDLRQIPLPSALVVDLMTEALGGGDSEGAIVAALRALSQVGLGEVWTYLRTPAQLSVGQRWRLRLALALAAAKTICDEPATILTADEFAAPLDRITALVVSRAVRKAITAQPHLCAIVATGRDDLLSALQPDVHIRCDFGTCDITPKGGLS